MNQKVLLVFLAVIVSVLCSKEIHSGERLLVTGDCYKASTCPELCPTIQKPICAVDRHGLGFEYPNHCLLNRAVCKENYHFRRILNGACCNHGIPMFHHRH